VTAAPVITEPEVTPATTAEPGPVTAAEERRSTAAEQAAATEPTVTVGQGLLPAEPVVAEPVAAAAEPEAPQAAEPNTGVPAPADLPATDDQSARQRPGAKKNAKARRSSVPSWDEIMLGSSRQRD
jgi:hypothetical protein